MVGWDEFPKSTFYHQEPIRKVNDMPTGIPYCKETWNVTAGCTKCAPGCENCWAERMSHRLAHIEEKTGRKSKYGEVIRGYPDDGKWLGKIYLDESILDKPLHWKQPRRIFVNSMSDLFHPKVPFNFITHVHDRIDVCQQHTFLIFTKRIERAKEYYLNELGGSISENIQLILSLSTQAEANEKIPYLLQIPAAVRGLSLEPLLGPIELRCVIVGPRRRCVYDCLRGCAASESGVVEDKVCGSVGWVVIGCESLPGLKPGRFRECKGAPWVSLSNPEAEAAFEEAAVNIVQQCQSANVPVYVKQLPINGKVSRNMDEWPKELQIQQYP